MGELFCVMFPDSEIAKSFKLGPSKCAYLITYCSIFQELSSAGCWSSSVFVASFDEYSNRITQDEQMDVVFRYWDTTEATGKTRYYSSEFLGHTRAEDLFNKFEQSMSRLEQKEMLQLSMDGPSVNWKVFWLLCERRESNGYHSIRW